MTDDTTDDTHRQAFGMHYLAGTTLLGGHYSPLCADEEKVLSSSHSEFNMIRGGGATLGRSSRRVGGRVGGGSGLEGGVVGRGGGSGCCCSRCRHGGGV
jgi:hypothetical protein